MMADDMKLQNGNYKAAIGKIEKLVDPKSFSQIGACVKDDNIVAGFAAIDTRPCYIYCQYGPVNLKHANKISKIYRMAVSMGVPVIALLDSDGIDMESGMDVLAAYGAIFSIMSDASGVIPQYSLIYGKCLGANAVISGLSDFSFGSKDASLFIQSPNTVSDIKTVGVDKFLSANYHYEQSGEINFLFKDPDDMNKGFKHFLSFMPLNNLEESPIQMGADSDNNSTKITSQSEHRTIIKAICDGGDFVEPGASFAKELITCFARFEGFSAAIISANGVLSKNAISKAVKFIAFCDAFNIPIVTLNSVTGLEASVLTQKNAVSEVASLARAFSCATVAKINIITKNSIGLMGLSFNSGFVGADLVYSWPDANIALFTEEQIKVLGANAPVKEFAAEKGYIDEIIEPNQTRKTIIYALENLLTKRVFKHPKKHGSLVF